MAVAALAAVALLPAIAAAANGERLSQVPAELEEKFRRLVVWLQAGLDAAAFGDRRPAPLAEAFELGVGRFGRSLVAGRDFEAGATITLLPLSHLIYMRDYSVGLEELMPNQQGAIYMARQRALGEESHWAPYIAMLPSSHADLPKYWEEGFLQEHMQGSHFAEFVRIQYDEVKMEYESAKAATGISWEDYQWGHDIYSTRSVYWNNSWLDDPEPRTRRSSGLFPLFDLLMHASNNNADYKFDTELKAMRLYASRAVEAGEELTISYFDNNTRSNTEVLSKWGFAAEGGRKMVEVTVKKEDGEEGPAGSDGEPPTYALELTTSDGAAIAFLANLRAMADQKPIQLPDLPEGWLAIPDPRTGWLYYWHHTSNEVTWARPGHPNGAEKPFWTPATTWGVEVAALAKAKDILAKAAATYPQSMEDDEELLQSDLPDPRVRFMVHVRRDEKEVIRWWQHVVQRALDGAQGLDPAATVEGEAHLDPSSPLWPPNSSHKGAPDEL